MSAFCPTLNFLETAAMLDRDGELLLEPVYANVSGFRQLTRIKSRAREVAMPSESYPGWLPIFEAVFASGIVPYTRHFEAPLVKCVTGVEKELIKPYLGTDKCYRGTYPGASGIFLASDDITTSAEVFGNLKFPRRSCRRNVARLRL